MSYEVFTLKYRPRSFDDVVGQESVAATLKRAVQTNRVANAYLLCGSRGVGKTSMARILSKALNCPQAIEGEPCNSCEVCDSIARGEDMDVIEIDGASNRGIDDIRGIRDGAGYVPSRGKYKIYIIDEVHMLTIQAFNALLKVLEEPPAHVKFVFATTDPNNLPDTILSRCQRHEFRRISEEDIVTRLRQICGREDVDCAENVLEAIARKAEGGLRDSISLLDQVVSYAGERIELADLERAIGVLPAEHLESLARTIAHQDLPGVLASIQAAFWSGYDPQELMAAATSWLRDYMVWHADPEGRKAGRTASVFEELEAQMPLDRVLYLTKLFLNLRGDIKRSGHERVQLELTCVKAARSAGMLPVEEIVARLKGKVAPPPAPQIQVAPAPQLAPKVAAPRPTPQPEMQAPRDRLQASPRPAPVAPKTPEPKKTPPSEMRPPSPQAPRPPREDAGNQAFGGADAGAQAVMEKVPMRRVIDAPSATPTLKSLREHWMKIIDRVKDTSSMVGSSLDQAHLESVNSSSLLLHVPQSNTFLCEQLSKAEALSMISTAIKAHCNWNLKVSVVQVAGGPGGVPVTKKSVYDDPTVRRFIEHFDGGIMNVEKTDG
ncbi:MAG: DNA polymerase-3 subunit gamma/tau [Planctomycetota bacterium]|jgi:DNA polymerase-3 subunit gamma/tau